MNRYFNELQKVFLASTSPRRSELLSQVGIPYEVVPSSYVEKNDFLLRPEELVKEQALGKAKAAILPEGIECNDYPILGADTIVVLDNQILGKPHHTEEAKDMLTNLSGKCHQVMTGIGILYKGDIINFVKTTNVYFRNLSTKEIDWYVATGEPLDKAGAYGIQGTGALWVEKIEGSYTNVVGLPVEDIYNVLKLLK